MTGKVLRLVRMLTQINRETNHKQPKQANAQASANRKLVMAMVNQTLQYNQKEHQPHTAQTGQ